VRVIDADGEQAGVMSREQALRMAEDAGLDLVEIVPNAEPPVVRVMDFGKYKYELQKKANVARKKQKQIEIKELKFRPGTDEHDYQVKMRSLRSFIGEGDKVKVVLRFRGREMSHMELGTQVLDRIEKDTADEVVVEARPKVEGKQMIMMLAPKRKQQ
jgi:translation initiation factor IF-3